MEDSIGSTIEKIKLQEQDAEVKLKEKRELESNISGLKKSIRDAKIQIEKSTTDQKELISTTDKLQLLIELEKIRCRAKSDQLNSMKSEYVMLKNKCDLGISNVWTLRSSLCQTVDDISDECDIWALLVKPVNSMIPQTFVKVKTDEVQLKNESRLQIAKEKREKLIAERDRLRFEPENGEEFVRIKNALNYSINIIANMRK